MAQNSSPTSPVIPASPLKPAAAKAKRRPFQILLLVLLAIPVIVVWQVLNYSFNNTDPTVAGQPLSNPKTHLHLVALGGQPGVVYLGTHYGLFTSTDGGHSWPQTQGVLNTLMILNLAISPANPQILAAIGRPSSGIGDQGGIYFSVDGGNSWRKSSDPSGLSLSAYLFKVQAGAGSAGHFYAFYEFAGWYETLDMGLHWHPITSGTLSNLQTPTLLTDPNDPQHLLLGGDQGLFETHDDGHSWNHLTAISGSVQDMVASTTSPRLIFCATDQNLYRWREGSTQISRLATTSLPAIPSRLSISANGTTLYSITRQDLWVSNDSGTTWKHRWQFDRGDLISFVIDPLNPQHLYAGFFQPGNVRESTDGGFSWHALTE